MTKIKTNQSTTITCQELDRIVKIKTNQITTITCQELDRIVKETYGKPYCFQQQNGCQNRGIVDVSVGGPDFNDPFTNDTVPEKVNGSEMGVSFNAWLKRDPKEPIADGGTEWLGMWWERNFYPDLDMVLHDLYKRGLIDAGEYTIIIDW